MFIGNEEVVCDKEFTITEEMLSTSSTILNNCYPKSWEQDHDYVGRFYYPEDFSKFRLYKDNELKFCGIVRNTGNISLNPREPKYCSLQILDFKDFLSNGETLDFVINNETITQAIRHIVNTVSDYGFVLGNVNILNGDDVIGAYSTENKTAYDVFQYLADISGSRWTTRMLDEYTVAIDFYDPTLMPRADDIEYTTEYFEANNIDDIKFNYGTYDYRNKQVILSDEVYAGVNYTETIYGDGYNKTFNLSSNIGNMVSITVNGTSKTIITKAEYELGFDADFYYETGKNEIIATSTYALGDNITVIYTPLVQGRQVVFNNDEVSRITDKIGRKGIIARYETRNDVLSNDELEKVGQSYIKYKGSPEIKLIVKTHDKDLFNVGQIVYFDAPIEELRTDYMIKTKKTNIISVNSAMYIFYEYELTSNFNSENAINYFDNQRAKSTGNIQEGDFITRNIDIANETQIIFDNLSVNEVSVDGTNVLNSTLNSPFNN
jgi:hypothetical protein